MLQSIIKLILCKISPLFVVWGLFFQAIYKIRKLLETFQASFVPEHCVIQYSLNTNMENSH